MVLTISTHTPLFVQRVHLRLLDMYNGVKSVVKKCTIAEGRQMLPKYVVIKYDPHVMKWDVVHYGMDYDDTVKHIQGGELYVDVNYTKAFETREQVSKLFDKWRKK